MNFEAFQFYRTPKIIFGAGKITSLSTLAAMFGHTVLLIHGRQSLSLTTRKEIEIQCKNSGIVLFTFEASGEPSPSLIDEIVTKFTIVSIDLVVAIGGGSILDTGKAVSAMLPLKESVITYLEGIGSKKHPGIKVPFIAIPTTAGTGSEGSANAVLSIVGKNGFKRSLRHDNLVPDIALIDPDLMISCSQQVTAACGMDTLTQLIESYVSPNASPITDALIVSSLPDFRENLLAAAYTSPDNRNIRAAIAYGSMISGITLANAGLGVVHGIASAIGGFFPISHGVLCGTLLAPATKFTIKKLKKQHPNSPALEKYAQIATILLNNCQKQDDKCDLLIEFLYNLSDQLKIPSLKESGIAETDLDMIIKESSNKNNPVTLHDQEIRTILLERMID